MLSVAKTSSLSVDLKSPTDELLSWMLGGDADLHGFIEAIESLKQNFRQRDDSKCVKGSTGLEGFYVSALKKASDTGAVGFLEPVPNARIALEEWTDVQGCRSINSNTTCTGSSGARPASSEFCTVSRARLARGAPAKWAMPEWLKPSPIPPFVGGKRQPMPSLIYAASPFRIFTHIFPTNWARPTHTEFPRSRYCSAAGISGKRSSVVSNPCRRATSSTLNRRIPQAS